MREKAFVIMGSSNEMRYIHKQLILQAKLRNITVIPIKSLEVISNKYQYISLYVYIDGPYGEYNNFWSMTYHASRYSIDPLREYNSKRKDFAPILTLSDLPLLLDLMS